MSGSKKACVFIADGSEEIELVTPVDILRRAKVEVTLVGVPDCSSRKCLNGISICPDKGVSDVVNEHYDVLVVPGGSPGVKALIANDGVKSMLKKQADRGGLIAAICAGPLILKAHGIGLKKSITAYPNVKDELVADYNFKDNVKTVVDGEIITSGGPGTAMDFALTIAEILVGKPVRDQITQGLVML